MNILFTRFPLESAYGGAEVQTLSLMEGLRKRGNDVAFLGSCSVLLEKTRAAGFEVRELDIGPPPVTIWRVLSFVLWRQYRMKRALFDAVQAHSPASEPLCICMLSLSEKLLLTFWAFWRGIKVIWIEHDRVGNWLKYNPLLPTFRRLSGLVTTVCVSEMSRKIYVDGLGFDASRVVAIPNGIDTARFSPQNSNPKSQVSNLHLGCVARLTEDKGVDLLIQAIADMPGITLDIVGQGREEGYLRKLALELDRHMLGSSDRIRFLPNVPDVAAFYQSVDALVLPSREHDPFGMAAAEAMCAGLPVVVTDQCGIAEYLRNDDDALIVKANDVATLKEAISKLHDPALRLQIGARARETALRQFALETMVERYEKLLS